MQAVSDSEFGQYGCATQVAHPPPIVIIIFGAIKQLCVGDLFFLAVKIKKLGMHDSLLGSIQHSSIQVTKIVRLLSLCGAF